ncbi:chaperone modulator CbpM [Lutibacter holmesii]|uniref:Chaperone modulator CbpM n=1 Tax=Lutibacter holmesii TaxID=1137985 RepID=A0ABW3WKU6_9FLAO
MEGQNFISILQLCDHYNVEVSFFKQLEEEGLVEITTVKQTQCLHQNSISDVEKMIRIHQELKVNIEGIDVVFNLLQKMKSLQNEMNSLQNRLRLYENDF